MIYIDMYQFVSFLYLSLCYFAFWQSLINEYDDDDDDDYDDSVFVTQLTLQTHLNRPVSSHEPSIISVSRPLSRFAHNELIKLLQQYFWEKKL